jgi:hypothetical protein
MDCVYIHTTNPTDHHFLTADRTRDEQCSANKTAHLYWRPKEKETCNSYQERWIRKTSEKQKQLATELYDWITHADVPIY